MAPGTATQPVMMRAALPVLDSASRSPDPDVCPFFRRQVDGPSSRRSTARTRRTSARRSGSQAAVGPPAGVVCLTAAHADCPRYLRGALAYPSRPAAAGRGRAPRDARGAPHPHPQRPDLVRLRRAARRDRDAGRRAEPSSSAVAVVALASPPLVVPSEAAASVAASPSPSPRPTPTPDARARRPARTPSPTPAAAPPSRPPEPTPKPTKKPTSSRYKLLDRAPIATSAGCTRSGPATTCSASPTTSGTA